MLFAIFILFYCSKIWFVPSDIDYLICRYDARNKGNVTLWSEEEPNGFGKRAYFQVKSPDGVLHLEKISYNEGGLFRCRVDFQTAQTRNSLFNLTVIGKIKAQLIANLTAHNLKWQTIEFKTSLSCWFFPFSSTRKSYFNGQEREDDKFSVVWSFWWRIFINLNLQNKRRWIIAKMKTNCCWLSYHFYFTTIKLCFVIILLL